MNNLSRQKKYVIIASTMAMVFMLVVVVFSLEQQPRAPLVTVSPTPISPTITTAPEDLLIENVVIGKTTAKEVEKMANVTRKQLLDNGRIAYFFNGNTYARPDEVITRDNLVIFKRIRLSSTFSYKIPHTLSEFHAQYGEADRQLYGSKFYGQSAKYYIYSTKGFVLIGNSYTGDVYEIQISEPMSSDDYIVHYGDDIVTEIQPLNY